jgi:hypothetical protein
MRKTREDLPFWAKVLFETPELVAELAILFQTSLKIWRSQIHARSRWFELIEELEREEIR